MVFQIQKQKPKKEKEDDFFMLDNKKEKEKSIFELDDKKEREKEQKEKYEERIQEINDDLESSDSPIRLVDKFTLKIESNGQSHTISRHDLSEYQRKYSLEDGSDDNRAITTFRSLGSIHGNYELLDKIYDDSHRTFNRLDGDSSYKTANIEGDD